MKRILDIAYECGISKQLVNDSIKRLGLKPAKKNNMIIIKPHEEDLILYNLFSCGKITEITLESKINL